MPSFDFCLGCCCVGIVVLFVVASFIPDAEDTIVDLNDTSNNSVVDNTTLGDLANNTTLNNSSVNTTNENNNSTSMNISNNTTSNRTSSNGTPAKGSQEAQDTVEQETGYSEEDIEYMSEYYEQNSRRGNRFIDYWY